MNEAIKNIAQAIIREAESVKSHTWNIEALEKLDAKDSEAEAYLNNALKTLEISRLEDIEHIQNLTISLTKLISKGSLPGGSMKGENNG